MKLQEVGAWICAGELLTSLLGIRVCRPQTDRRATLAVNRGENIADLAEAGRNYTRVARSRKDTKVPRAKVFTEPWSFPVFLSLP